ncbi:MAG: ferredoxin family protein [Candidatus Lambdaproteobacteria bacterium]|nr:ferredoxin family protein [Candidatus Lambdaproteobacteria bacterium]
MSLTERLSTIHFTVDETPHITVDGGRCLHCATHPCLVFCPTRCFTPADAGGISYSHAGCVECGTCLVLCNRAAVTWRYPQGGYGVAYRF